MDFHPVSEIFPLMDDSALCELANDIKANGLREAIWTHDGKIIDGRNRYRACQIANVEPCFREWPGDGDVLKFVVSLNLHRRHLNESQRAMIAAKIAQRPHGRQPTDPRNLDAGIRTSSIAPTAKQAAELLNVNKSTVSDAKMVRRDAIPEVVTAVESGEVSLHAAKQIAAEPKQKQREALENTRNGIKKPSRTPARVNISCAKIVAIKDAAKEVDRMCRKPWLQVSSIELKRLVVKLMDAVNAIEL